MRFEYNHFAFLGPESVRAAEATECANEQGMFWPYHDTLFLNQIAENQGFWSNTFLLEMALQLGLVEQAFSDCLDSGKYRDAIAAAKEAGDARGVNSTPTVFINGEKVVGLDSAQAYIQLIEVILGQ